MSVLNPVDKFYRSVIEDVLQECREIFLNDGVDEIVLTDLKRMWEQKVKESKVFEFTNLNSSNSFRIGSYGIISSSRNTACPEILVPSIHLAGPRSDGSNNSCTPTATIALPYGLYQQQISALNNAGISLQPSGNGQFLAFLRPDQQRLQHLATFPDSRKLQPIVVSTPLTIPVRPETMNFNIPVPNRVSTSPSPAKGGSDLKKQKILPTPTANFVGKVLDRNIAPQGAENSGYSKSVTMKINNSGNSIITTANKSLNNGSTIAASLNSSSTEYTKLNVTSSANISLSQNSNICSNIKTMPIDVTTNYNAINNVNSFKIVANTPINNSIMRNNCVLETISQNTTSNTFGATENTYPSLSVSSNDTNTNTLPQLPNKQICNNPAPATMPSRFSNQPVTNSHQSNSAFYNPTDNNKNQTDGISGISNTATSLEDFIDNISDSQTNSLVTNGTHSSDFDYSVNRISGPKNSASNIYNAHTFPGLTTGNSLTTNCKSVPPNRDAVAGLMCRFSEEDMQTIQEILQFDGAGDEYLLKSKTELIPDQTFFRFSPNRSPVENNAFCEVNNSQTTKAKSKELYQNCRASRKAKTFNDQNSFPLYQLASDCLQSRSALKTASSCDYVSRRKTNSTGQNSVSKVNTVPQTASDQKCYFKTEIQKIRPPNKNKPILFAQNISDKSPMLKTNCFGNFQNFSIETRPELKVFRSSDHQAVPVLKGTSTINTGSPKHNISKTEVEAIGGFNSLRGCFHRQFDGEDADSSSSSDDNANTNDVASDEDDDDDECEETNEEEEDFGIESEPLNSADDDSDIDICAMFESENIVVCQFEKVSRNKNKWKFHLKDGIMNLFGRDLIFSKSVGDAEW